MSIRLLLLNLILNSGRIPFWYPNRAACDNVMPQVLIIICMDRVPRTLRPKSRQASPRRASELMRLRLDARLGEARAP